ncbi:MAG TPA: hypothetical protein VK927_10295, partial [Adhaeribacter sp.]|nr:hypothetical protein [Adhaeribacter sp.]
MKLSLTTLLLTISAYAFAQGSQSIGVASAELDVSNIKPTLLTAGDMFRTAASQTLNFEPAFEVPRGSGLHTIFTGGLWIGGKDQTGQLYVASETYRQGWNQFSSFWPGPVAITQNAAHTAK